MPTQMEGNEAPTRQPLRPSVSRNLAPILCPLCALLDRDVQGVVSVEGYEDERGSRAILGRVELPCGHTEDHLTQDQADDALTSAVEWLSDGREALRDMANDQAFDYSRDEGRFND